MCIYLKAINAILNKRLHDESNITCDDVPFSDALAATYTTMSY